MDSIPRTVAGTVTETGDIADQSGKSIGNIANSETPKDLVGSAVMATGDIVNSSGDVLSKATLKDGAGEYTTAQAKDEDITNARASSKPGYLSRAKGAYDAISGAGRAVDGVLKTVDGTVKPLSDGLGSGPQGQAPKTDAEQEAKPAEAENIGAQGKQVEPSLEEEGGVQEGDTPAIQLENKDEEQPTCHSGEALSDADAAHYEIGERLESDNGKEQTEQHLQEAQDDSAAAEGLATEGEETVKDAAGETEGELPNAEQGVDVAATAAEGVVEQPVDFSILKGLKVNKGGNLVNKDGIALGRIVEGDNKKLVGKSSDENGDIWNDSGKKVGKAEPIPQDEREGFKESATFENFPDAVVEGDGRVMYDGKQVGVVVEGDLKRLKGAKVDEDGDILDRSGNPIGKALAWDEPAAEQEAEVDRSILAGKRVNKAGNVVDSAGVIYGRVVEGNVSSIVGRMSDKEGNVRGESGDVVGKAELVPESEREGSKEGPFAELQGCTVGKNGKIYTPSGDIVGRLTSGDPKALFGRAVDEDGDILDRNGNVLAKAEWWEEIEAEKRKDPLAGRKVNREGNVLDDDGNIVGKLTSGDINICAGKEVDDDGDVFNYKGSTIGHVNMLEDIPPEPQPEESAEEKQAREQVQKDKKLAGQLSYCIEDSLQKIHPICKRITDKIDNAERQPKEELDEEQLVKEVRPLIEDGGRILTETNGMIRGMDPDGRIQRNAKQKAATRDASPEEYHLAEVLKEVSFFLSFLTPSMSDMRRLSRHEIFPIWGKREMRRLTRWFGAEPVLSSLAL